MPRGEQEEKKEERTGERQDDDTTRDRLAAAANENLKKDNKKPIEEHEEDWTKKTDLKRKEGHPDRACRRGLTLWPASVFLRENPARTGQEDDKERTRKGNRLLGLLSGVVLLAPHCFVAHACVLSCLHADRCHVAMLRYCGLRACRLTLSDYSR